MNKLLKSFVFIILTALLIACNSVMSSSQKSGPDIKNVILMIGDGMGIADVSAAMAVSETPLNILRCTVTGLQTTSSADNYITDSGAAGTALATGHKTNNGRIGMDPDGNPVKSILEIAVDHGLSAGLVATSAITNATPAAFIAHQPSRYNYEGIARDFLRTNIDVFIGGGLDNFVRRKDNINLLDSLRSKGYEIDTTMSMIMQSQASRLAGFTAPMDNPFRLKGRGDMLPEASAKAIEILKNNKKGFFLMIEGSQIDWAGHSNIADTLIDETLDFDRAVGKALDFAEKDGHTLVVVTADHETGGVTITNGNPAEHKVTLAFSSKGHTPVLIPVYVFGPGAEKFTGIYDNTDIFRKIDEALGLER
ncbi:MAG TPA: alkaline phosphatase [Bacteroidales bacterium]|nr:alkaline phosphatase [Bacteroidales bacterium]